MSIRGGFLMPHPPIIIPEVGNGRERDAGKTVAGMKSAAKMIAQMAPETIIVITPHGPVFSDAAVIHEKEVIAGDLSSFGVPEVKMSKVNNRALVNRILQTSSEAGIAIATLSDQLTSRFHVSEAMDHGTLVPLYYVDQEYSQYELVSITYGLFGHETLYRLGMAIQKAVEDLGIKAVIIASGDLSHKLKTDGPYEFNPQGPIFDQKLMALLEQNQFEEVILMDAGLCEDAGECGKRSVDMMLGALEGYTPKTTVYSYEGPFGVGYGVVGIEVGMRSPQHQHYANILEGKRVQLQTIRSNEDDYVQLARAAIEHFVQTGTRYKVDEEENKAYKAMLNRRAGVFVSIKNSGGLRGCIGTIGATEKSVVDEIIVNATKAASEDPRFDNVEVDELDGLIISVDILMPAEQVQSKSELNPKEYGVIVTSGYKRGLLLPNLEGIDTVDEQVNIALSKGGIRETEAYTLERFKVERHK